MNPFPTEDSNLEEAIASAFADLKAHSADEEGYQKAVDQLTKLYKLKTDMSKLNLEFQQSEAEHALEQQKLDHRYDEDNRPFYKRVDPNVVLTVAGNIFIGLAVIKYEQTGVISTKVRDFMKKI